MAIYYLRNEPGNFGKVTYGCGDGSKTHQELTKTISLVENITSV